MLEKAACAEGAELFVKKYLSNGTFYYIKEKYF